MKTKLHILIFLLSFSSFFCRQNREQVSKQTPERYLSTTQAAEDETDFVKPLSKSLEGMVDHSGDTLRIRLKNGQQKIYVTNATGPAYVRFSFGGFLPKQHFFIVNQSWDEGDYVYLLVRESDGFTYSILDYPIVSPDGKFFVAYSFQLPQVINANAIDICRFNGDSISLSYEIEPDTWGPKDVKWIGNDTLRITKATPTDSTFQMFVDSEAFLVRRDTIWTLSDH